MSDRIEELFQQVMDENCKDPLRRFAELVAADEREANKREWVSLTDDESSDIYNAHHNTYGECITSAYELVLDVEAKLKERNT